MSAFWIVILIGVAIFIYSQFKRNNNLSVYDNNRSVIDAWINSKDGKLETFMYSIYQNDALTVNRGSTIFVGCFDRRTGGRCGFYFEIRDGKIILDKLYFPEGITSWHSTRAREALNHGVSLFQLLNLAESDHQEKFPKWRNKE